MSADPVLHPDIHLDDVPAPEPVHYAEQALLGALLLDPEQLRSTGQLRAEHFASPAHAAIYAAMRTLTPPPPDQHTKNPLWPAAVHEAAHHENRGLTAGYLHALINACPTPRHASAYLGMIRADHARRTLRIRAQHLGQTATDPTLPDPAEAVLEEADDLGLLLEHLAGEFPPHRTRLPRTAVPPPPVPDTDEEVLHEERLFLASATSHSADLRWLHPGDFALPLHGQLYECLTTLHHRGDPIDPVTLMWEAQRRSLLTTIDPADLLTLTSRTNSTSSPDYWGERILQRALLTGAQNAAHHIQTYTDDPSNTPHQLITGSRRALATFTEIRTRWHTTQPHPPTASGPRPPHTAPTVPRLRSTTAHAFTPSTLPATSARPTR